MPGDLSPLPMPFHSPQHRSQWSYLYLVFSWCDFTSVFNTMDLPPLGSGSTVRWGKCDFLQFCYTVYLWFSFLFFVNCALVILDYFQFSLMWCNIWACSVVDFHVAFYFLEFVVTWFSFKHLRIMITPGSLGSIHITIKYRFEFPFLHLVWLSSHTEIMKCSDCTVVLKVAKTVVSSR